jgi:hypothetical protein
MTKNNVARNAARNESVSDNIAVRIVDIHDMSPAESDALDSHIESIKDDAADAGTRAWLQSEESDYAAIVFGTYSILAGSMVAALRGNAITSEGDDDRFRNGIVRRLALAGVTIHRATKGSDNAKAKAYAAHDANLATATKIRETKGRDLNATELASLATSLANAEKMESNYFESIISDLNDKLPGLKGAEKAEALAQRNAAAAAIADRKGFDYSFRVAELRKAAYALAKWARRPEGLPLLATLATMESVAGRKAFSEAVEQAFGSWRKVNLSAALKGEKAKPEAETVPADPFAAEREAEKAEAKATAEANAKAAAETDMDHATRRKADLPAYILSLLADLDANAFRAVFQGVQREAHIRNGADSNETVPPVDSTIIEGEAVAVPADVPALPAPRTGTEG